MINNNILDKESQACNGNSDYFVLEDIVSGHEINWQGHKSQSLLLSDSYFRIARKALEKNNEFDYNYYLKRARRVYKCGSRLQFIVADDLQTKKLFYANFCKVRLCPMCAWRRSLKVFAQVSQVMDKIDKNQYEFLFLTLTIKNVGAEELEEAIDNLHHGFNRLIHTKRFKDVVKGYFKALEVTHNSNYYSKSFDTFHPHLHIVLVVSKSYFKSRDYINKNDWVSMWRDCMNLDYMPSVDIRKASKGAIAEVAKYTVKSTDYIYPKDKLLTDKTVQILDEALYSRRLCAFGGIMSKIRKQLALDDIDNGDLVRVDGELVSSELFNMIVTYHWNIGLSNYVLVATEQK